MTLSAIHFIVFLTVIGGSSADQCPEFTTKNNFKVTKYIGEWYGISRLPNFIITNTTCDNATYTIIANGSVTIFNQGINPQGQYQTVRGVATVIDPKVPGAFRVLFETGQLGTYNVLATDYKNYASVYDCEITPGSGIKIEYGFILSRRKTLKASKLRKAIRSFTKIGIDYSRFIPIPQNC